MATRIVVGVDGSPQARRALDHAIEEARRRDAVLRVVHAWTSPTVIGPPAYAGIMPTHQQCQEAAHAVLSEVVAHLPCDVTIEQVVRQGPPARELVAEAEDADMLVVGTRGRGGFTGLLLGSTSHQVACHAHGPVLVVPGEAA